MNKQNVKDFKKALGEYDLNKIEQYYSKYGWRMHHKFIDDITGLEHYWLIIIRNNSDCYYSKYLSFSQDSLLSADHYKNLFKDNKAINQIIKNYNDNLYNYEDLKITDKKIINEFLKQYKNIVNISNDDNKLIIENYLTFANIVGIQLNNISPFNEEETDAHTNN